MSPGTRVPGVFSYIPVRTVGTRSIPHPIGTGLERTLLESSVLLGTRRRCYDDAQKKDQYHQQDKMAAHQYTSVLLPAHTNRQLDAPLVRLRPQAPRINGRTGNRRHE